MPRVTMWPRGASLSWAKAGVAEAMVRKAAPDSAARRKGVWMAVFMSGERPSLKLVAAWDQKTWLSCLSAASGSLELQYDCINRKAVARLRVHRLDRPRLLRAQDILHLHRLDDGERL